MRVLVCRASEDGQATARRLADAGHEAVLAPVLEIRSLSVTLPTARFDALLLTSRHAFAALDEARRRGLAGLPVYAVGASTAKAARGAGFADVRTAAGDATSLADLVSLTQKPGAALLYLAGRDRKPLIEDGLQARGYRLVIVETYEARLLRDWSRDVAVALRDGSVEACLHFSARSAAASVAAAQTAQIWNGFAQLHHFCISSAAAAPLLAHGLLHVSVAEEATELALIEALSRSR